MMQRVMWPWKRKEKGDTPATDGGRLAEVESQVRMLKGEWLDTLDRMERLAGRLAKRAEREQGAPALTQAPQAEPEGPRAPYGGSRAMADVLKRRARPLVTPTNGEQR